MRGLKTRSSWRLRAAEALLGLKQRRYGSIFEQVVGHARSVRVHAELDRPCNADLRQNLERGFKLPSE